MANKIPFSLEGKRILVTGASSGIGRATAVECSKMGAQVIIVGRDEVRLHETLDMLDREHTHSMFQADITNEVDLKFILDGLPAIDGAVMNAGIAREKLPVAFCDRRHFDEIFNVNFFGNVELTRLLFKHKKINKDGSIVFISSIGGNRSYYVGSTIYGSSKAALESYMKYAAKEFATRKIRVNSIQPGMIETPLIHRGAMTEDDLKEDMKQYPLKRFGRPEEVAYAAIYLLSDAAAWVTGSTIVIDGGISI